MPQSKHGECLQSGLHRHPLKQLHTCPKSSTLDAAASFPENTAAWPPHSRAPRNRQCCRIQVTPAWTRWSSHATTSPGRMAVARAHMYCTRFCSLRVSLTVLLPPCTAMTLALMPAIGHGMRSADGACQGLSHDSSLWHCKAQYAEQWLKTCRHALCARMHRGRSFTTTALASAA